MLSMDFEEEINKILAVIPSGKERRTFLFSATMTSKVRPSVRHLSIHSDVRTSQRSNTYTYTCSYTYTRTSPHRWPSSSARR